MNKETHVNTSIYEAWVLFDSESTNWLEDFYYCVIAYHRMLYTRIYVYFIYKIMFELYLNSKT